MVALNPVVLVYGGTTARAVVMFVKLMFGGPEKFMPLIDGGPGVSIIAGLAPTEWPDGGANDAPPPHASLANAAAPCQELSELAAEPEVGEGAPPVEALARLGACRSAVPPAPLPTVSAGGFCFWAASTAKTSSGSRLRSRKSG